MRIESNSIRNMPLHIQEQVAVALIPSENPRKVLVCRLRFPDAQAAEKYMALRWQEKLGLIHDLIFRKNEAGLITRCTYSRSENLGGNHGR